jgi:hypothetical protein
MFNYIVQPKIKILDFININKLNKNNPDIGYFSQFNNKKVINKNVFSNINNSWYPYYKVNPFIRSRLVPSLGTNIILSDETINEAIYKSYLNFTYSERETNDSIDENTQSDSEIYCTRDKKVQTDNSSNLLDCLDLDDTSIFLEDNINNDIENNNKDESDNDDNIYEEYVII